MKGKPEGKKDKETHVDYESLYYKAMQENILLKEKKISLEFTDQEISILKDLLYEELMDIKFDSVIELPDDEKEEGKLLGRLNRDDFFNLLIDEKKNSLETLIKKLRFEI